ncbi:hypothetical protein MLD38_025741 [Melastoma candidum]|uniref:Uncharacterized protein n=1 Tax=Melastoma candidum TaxID=119954 RepID=A0ACB9NZH4_9MYRT|nr:hypothetical protein MLD38_025741 [Melastoma candidum]
MADFHLETNPRVPGSPLPGTPHELAPAFPAQRFLRLPFCEDLPPSSPLGLTWTPCHARNLWSGSTRARLMEGDSLTSFSTRGGIRCWCGSHAKIEGRGGHAAVPHNSVDPGLAASSTILALQQLV